MEKVFGQNWNFGRFQLYESVSDYEASSRFFMVFQAFTGFYNVFVKFKNYFVGEKLTEEIRMDIYGRKNPFLVWLERKMEAIDINIWKKEMIKEHYLFERFSTNPFHPDYVSPEELGRRVDREIDALDNEYEKLSNEIIQGFKKHFLGQAVFGI